MKIYFRLLGCAAVFLVLGIEASGQSRRELGFQIYVGHNHTQSSRFELEHPATRTALIFPEVHWEGQSFNRPLYYGFRGSLLWWKVGAFEVAPEFEFIHLKVYLKADQESQAIGILQERAVRGSLRINTVLEDFNISHGVDLFLFNAVIKRGLLFSRLGAGFNISHFESTLRGFPHHEEDAFGGRVYHLAIGIAVPLKQRFNFLTEYKFTSTGPRGPVFGGEAEASLNTHHLVYGLGFRW